jgi:hypothetical protein
MHANNCMKRARPRCVSNHLGLDQSMLDVELSILDTALNFHSSEVAFNLHQKVTCVSSDFRLLATSALDLGICCTYRGCSLIFCEATEEEIGHLVGR